MPKILNEEDVDQIAEDLDSEMTAAEEEDAFARVASARAANDLSDGGKVGGARIYPTRGGVKQEQGRAASRMSWMWDGTVSELPLAWNPDGTQHDGARHYLLKRHCLCCGASGFFGPCKACIKANCQHCEAGTNQKKVIPCFYLRKSQVPFPAKFFGSIPCFMPTCPRQGSKGFKSEEDMRIHARKRHGMEYQAHTETLAAHKADEVDQLREQVNLLLASLARGESVTTINEGKVPGRPRKQETIQ